MTKPLVAVPNCSPGTAGGRVKPYGPPGPAMLSDTVPRLGWVAVNSTSRPVVKPAQPLACSCRASCPERSRRVGRSSGRGALPVPMRKELRLDEAEDVPDGQEGNALQREALELEEQLRDHESQQEGDRFLLERNPDTEILDQREHRPLL